MFSQILESISGKFSIINKIKIGNSTTIDRMKGEVFQKKNYRDFWKRMKATFGNQIIFLWFLPLPISSKVVIEEQY